MNVEQWLAANGGPRKFARGDSGDLFALKSWLLARGYEFKNSSMHISIKKIGTYGAPRKMTPTKVIEFVDELRRAEGLEPLRRRS